MNARAEKVRRSRCQREQLALFYYVYLILVYRGGDAKRRLRPLGRSSTFPCVGSSQGGLPFPEFTPVYPMLFSALELRITAICSAPLPTKLTSVICETSV